MTESIHLKGNLGTYAFIQYQRVDRSIEIDSFWIQFLYSFSFIFWFPKISFV